MASAQEELTRVAGKPVDDRPGVRFFYLLLRDHLPAGTVQEILEQALEVVEDGRTSVYTNGFLGRYAQYLTDTLVKGEYETAPPFSDED